jgi:two-component system chemotaxis response regulator CheB
VAGLRVILAEARPVRRHRLGSELSVAAGLTVVASCASLMETYSLVESGIADAVLVSAEFRSVPEFSMFAELARLLGVTLVPLDDDSPAPVDRLARLARSAPAAPPPRAERGRGAPPPTRGLAGDEPIVVLGASTGGVEALHRLLTAFPEDCPPTLVVQHIRGDFSAAFADRLDRACRARVFEASDGRPLARGEIVVAPGSERHLELRHAAPVCRLVDAPPVTGHRPSVDALFRSAAPYGARIVAALLTGMGQDGARGLLEIRRAGGHTIAQDRETSTVYGMPRVAAEMGSAADILPLDRIASAMLRAASRTRDGSFA